MMNKLRDCLRFIFISPEMLTVIVMCGLYIMCFDFFTTAGNEIFLKDNFDWMIICSIPATLFSTSLVYLFKIHFPKNENKILLNWPGFNQLSARAWFSFIIVCTGALGTIILGLLRMRLKVEILGFAYLTLLSVSAITVFTMLKAAITLRIILEQNGSNKDQ